MYLCVSELRGARPVRQYCRISRRAGVQEGWYPDSAGAKYWRHRGLVAVLTAGETGQAPATVLLPPRVLLVLCCHLMLVIFLLYLSFYSPLLYLSPLSSSFWCLMSVQWLGYSLDERGFETGRHRLWVGRSGVRNWATPALGPTQLRYRCYFPVTNRSGMMMTADLHKAEIKSGWSCTYPPPLPDVFITWMWATLHFGSSSLVVFIFLFSVMWFSFPLFFIRSL